MSAPSQPPLEQVSSLPLPPVQYISNFSEEMIRRGRTPKPPPPIHDSYSMFGNQFNADDTIIRSLESQGIKRLYPQHSDRRNELKKLNHSLLVNFLDLIDTLVQCPDSPKRTEKVEDISLLFIHIHHLLNEFRPHQARETLRVMMDLQKRQRNEVNQRFMAHLDKVNNILSQAIDNLPETDLDSKLLIDTHNFANDDANRKDDGSIDGVNPYDRLMCEIVDNMSMTTN